jgi:membrane-bound metal-dependent hydrolase YbcI (DUF457 family)
MPSPLAHSLAGLTIAHALGPEKLRGSTRWVGLALLAANAPDLDFFAGLAIGSINALHGGPTHSLGAALLFATAIAASVRSRGGPAARAFVAASAVYVSHVLLDMACESHPGRPGLPLFWPLDGSGYLFPWRPLPGIAHGEAGDGIGGFLGELFSAGNLAAACVEIAVFAPPLWLAYRRLGVPTCLRTAASPADR